ncbi:30S ribosomal protein S5 [Candidatus Dependentiae bacterium]|nr:MAG: 30S ribosomal protein S5 [Candidatus Dependentiae bacterium]
MAKKEKLEADSGFVDHVVSVRRVTKVTKGGKRFSFSAFVVSGDRAGQVGIALGKSKEATAAITKATNKARKNMVTVPLRGTTIPYQVHGKHGAAKVVLIPASKGTGKIAGGAIRAVIDAAGIEDALTKSLGTANGLNVAKATLNALAKLRSAEQFAKLRGMTIDEMVKGK